MGLCIPGFHTMMGILSIQTLYTACMQNLTLKIEYFNVEHFIVYMNLPEDTPTP